MTGGDVTEAVLRRRVIPVVVLDQLETAAPVAQVIAALDLGLELLKFFPAESSGGIAALNALGGPLPQVRWIPTGGISAANASAYLALPSVAAVGGSWMVAPQLVAARDYAGVARLAREDVDLAAEAGLR